MQAEKVGGQPLGRGLLSPATRGPVPRQQGTNALTSATRPSEPLHATDLLLPRLQPSVAPRQRVARGSSDTRAERPGLQHHDPPAAPLAGARELGPHGKKSAAVPAGLPRPGAAGAP